MFWNKKKQLPDIRIVLGREYFAEVDIRERSFPWVIYKTSEALAYSADRAIDSAVFGSHTLEDATVMVKYFDDYLDRQKRAGE